MQRFRQQKFFDRNLRKKKISPSSKYRQTVRFVVLILISIATALLQLPLLWKIQKYSFFFPMVVKFQSYWQRNMKKEHIPFIFILTLILLKIALHFSVTLYFLVRWTMVWHCLNEGQNNCFLHYLKAILSVKLFCAQKEEKLRGREDFSSL